MMAGEAGRGAWWGALIGAWLVLCIPLLLVEVPPLGDYPNHLARMVVLAHLHDVPFFAEVYAVHWAITPDLAMDSFMPWLVTVLPVHVAGRLLLALVLLLEVGGAAACATALQVRRSWWSLGAALVAYQYAFMLGFVNFDLTLGAGMVLAALWMRLRSRPWRAALVGAASGALLFMGHLMGLCFYLALIGSYEASLFWARRRRLLDGRAMLQGWPFAAALLPPALLYLESGLHQASGRTYWLPWSYRAMETMSGVMNYDWALDVFSLLAILLFLLACVHTQRLHLAPGGAVAMVVLAVAFPLMPNDIKGTSLVAVRLAVMLAFLLFIALRPELPRRAALWAGAGFAALFLVRVAVVGVAWWDYRTDVAGLRALLSHVEPGQRVAELDISVYDTPDYYHRAPTAWRLSDALWTENHLMALTLIERRAFWPYLFVNPDQQSVVLQPAWRALVESVPLLPDYSDLQLRRMQGDPPGANPFCAFDWMVLQGAWAEPHPETLSPDWLELVEANRTAALYRVRGGRTCAVTPPIAFARAPDPHV